MQTKDLDLLKLQTKTMQKDRDVQGFTAALNDQLRQLSENVNLALIYGRTDQLPEEVLDILAWQFKVDWYDATSDIVTKQKAIDDALLIQQILGTPAAVQRVIEIYFGDGQVEEWFDYGGLPFHFRVVTNNPEATNEKAALLTKAVNSVKRKSTRLESVIIKTGDTMDLYEGLALHTGDYLTVKQVV
jgi:phage tail P2-like protein